MVITSPKNSLLQAVRHSASKGIADAEGWIVAEGPHLLEEALRGSWIIKRVVATSSAAERWQHLISQSQSPLTVVSDLAFDATTATETAQGILTLLVPSLCRWSDLLKTRGPIVVLDAIQDPGNAGTIVRSAEAFGATGIVFGKGSVQMANGKFIRAASGSLFRMPVLGPTGVEVALQELVDGGFALYGLAPGAHPSITTVDFRGPCALFVGNEGAGLSLPVLSSARLISIPTSGVESVNAAVACSIALFEAARQRGLP